MMQGLEGHWGKRLVLNYFHALLSIALFVRLYLSVYQLEGIGPLEATLPLQTAPLILIHSPLYFIKTKKLWISTMTRPTS